MSDLLGHGQDITHSDFWVELGLTCPNCGSVDQTILLSAISYDLVADAFRIEFDDSYKFVRNE